MQIQGIIRKCGWLLLIPLLAGCGAATATVSPVATPTTVNMDAFASQIAGTVVAGITQTAYVTPTVTRRPTETPNPTWTPDPVYAPDGKLKSLVMGGNLYVQNGAGENVQLTYSNTDHDPFFSDDGKKIIFFRGYGKDALYAIDAAGGKEKQIISVPLLAVQKEDEIKAFTFIKNTHILLFNIYGCGNLPKDYPFANCFVGTYSVNVDTGEIEEIGQRVNGFSGDDHNFELSPNQQYLSIAGSGHINIFSFASGHFKLAYFGAFAYSITKGFEDLPDQYWLPDSSGLVIVSAHAGASNHPPDPPQSYDVFRYTLGKKAVRFDAIKATRGYAWAWKCIVSFSPDRNWAFFSDDRGETFRLWNLKDGHTQVYDLGGALCGAIEWSQDSKHFVLSNFQYGLLGSVDDTTFIKLPGAFGAWVDATHYTYYVEDGKNISKKYIAEIGGDSILILTPTPTPTPQ